MHLQCKSWTGTPDAMYLFHPFDPGRECKNQGSRAPRSSPFHPLLALLLLPPHKKKPFGARAKQSTAGLKLEHGAELSKPAHFAALTLDAETRSRYPNGFLGLQLWTKGPGAPKPPSAASKLSHPKGEDADRSLQPLCQLAFQALERSGEERAVPEITLPHEAAGTREARLTS